MNFHLLMKFAVLVCILVSLTLFGCATPDVGLNVVLRPRERKGNPLAKSVLDPELSFKRVIRPYRSIPPVEPPLPVD